MKIIFSKEEIAGGKIFFNSYMKCVAQLVPWMEEQVGALLNMDVIEKAFEGEFNQYIPYITLSKVGDDLVMEYDQQYAIDMMNISVHIIDTYGALAIKLTNKVSDLFFTNKLFKKCFKMIKSIVLAPEVQAEFNELYPKTEEMAEEIYEKYYTRIE